MKTYYGVYQLTTCGKVSYSVQKHKKVIFSTHSYTSLIRFLKNEAQHSLEIGITPMFKGSAWDESLEEEVFSYSY